MCVDVRRFDVMVVCSKTISQVRTSGEAICWRLTEGQNAPIVKSLGTSAPMWKLRRGEVLRKDTLNSWSSDVEDWRRHSNRCILSSIIVSSLTKPALSGL